MSSRRDLIMSRVRQVEADSQHLEPIPNLICSEVMPVSPDNKSRSYVENSDLGEDDFINDSFLKVCLKKNVNEEPIYETSVIVIEKGSCSSSSSDSRIEAPEMIPEKRISPRNSNKKPSNSYAIDNLSDNEVITFNDFDSDDSVKDKNYCITEDDTTDLDTSIEENNAIKRTKPNVYKPKLKNQRKCDKGAKAVDSEYQINQYSNNTQERVETETVRSDPVQILTENEIIQETANEERHSPSIIQSDDRLNEASKQTLTKKGTIRKRKIIEESLTERKEKKRISMIEKLSLKEPCKPTCKKLCSLKISTEQRQVINSIYSAEDATGKGKFIKNNVTVTDAASRKCLKKEPKRKLTFNYFFTVNGIKNPVQVCKTFFLATLGYNPKNDGKFFRVLHLDEEDDLKDKRGRHDRSAMTKDKDLISKHIKTYNPAISHYRREYAPHRLYLPSDITIAMMHRNFNKSHPESECSYEVYRRVIKSLNISFAALGNEECELCAVYTIHECLFNKAPNATCATCINNVEHRKRYLASRKAYKLDKKNVEEDKDNDTIYVCVDLQKVVMLPRMDSYKLAIFCPRIIAFNETFAPLGRCTKENNPYAVLWHEAISGRNVHDIVSAYRAFILHHRNKIHLVIWADNCSSQNKNWTLFSFLVDIVNSDLIEARSITIKYLEPGHTFNSADSFHHQVELSLQKMKNVCDFTDFVDAVQRSNSRLNTVKVMDTGDFYKYCDFHSEQKMRALKDREYVKNFTVVKVVRGEYNLYYKISHTEEEFTSLNFLQLKILKHKAFPEPEKRKSPRGVASSRKEKIVKDLAPLMLPSKRPFWRHLPTNEVSANLSKELDD